MTTRYNKLRAVRLDGYGIGFELKESYFNLAKDNCKRAADNGNMVSLF